MVPDHIDDLPRRDDDNRPLMLGLIDDFPQERRGTRQLTNWGWVSQAQSQSCCLSFWSGSRRQARNR